MSQDANQNAAAAAPAQPNQVEQTLGKLTETLTAMNQSFESRMAEMQNIINSRTQAPAPAPVQAAPETLDPYDPASVGNFKKQLAQEITSSLTSEISARESAARAKQAAINELATDYPELVQQDSDLTKSALKILATLDKSTQDSALGYKLAVREAAARAGLLPKSKRQAGAEDFSFGGSSSSEAPRRTKKADEIDEKTLMSAALMGVNVEDPKVLAELKKLSKRDFNKWE